MDLEAEIKKRVRDVPDYPKKGILFRDITPLLKDKVLFPACIDELANRTRVLRPDYIVGIEARGFIVASSLAYKMGAGFVPVRKKGKLPYTKVARSYSLEYGVETVEMHTDAVEKGSRVVVADDLLATGGTTVAAMELVKGLGAEVAGLVYIVELAGLKGRARIGMPDKDVFSLVKY